MSGGQFFNSWRGAGKGYLVGAALSAMLITANMKSAWLPFRDTSLADQITALAGRNMSGGTRDGDMDAVAVYNQSKGPVGG